MSSDSDRSQTLPCGELVIRTLAMPEHTNALGDIFGGWILSQMDIGGAILAAEVAQARVVTVAVDTMHFHCPVRVGDIVSCYAQLHKIGRTSLTIAVETWVQRHIAEPEMRVTRGQWTYVAIDEKNRQPLPVERPDNDRLASFLRAMPEIP